MTIQPRNSPQSFSRPGAVLLVVITMLVLFAVVGLAFVYYANSESNASRNNREAQAAFRADVEPELALAYFLGKLIYGDDNINGVYSAMRGHDLARLVFEGDPTSPITAFNGLGRQHNTGNTYGTLPAGLDDYNMINYTFFQADGFLRDPGRPGSRTKVTDPLVALKGGLNVPYTYADPNNMFLAVVNANGEVLARSFHRDWLFNWPPGATNYFALNDQTNPNWTSPQGKYYILCPRPQENPGFPFPEDGGGHVKNLDGWAFKGVPVLDASGNKVAGQYYNNDSIWMDLGAPVLTAPDGTKYKMLFAPCIIALDGKINLNVHGNLRGAGPPLFHVSNQGWGPWEVNLSRLLTQKPPEWTNIYLGNGTVKGRYAFNQKPEGNGTTTAPTSSEWPPRVFSLVDFDATKGPAYALSDQYQLPGEAAGYKPYVPYANFPAVSYGNNNAYEATDHPLLFNFFNAAGQGNLIFPARNMEALLRYGGTGSPSLNSELFNLLPNELLNSRARLLLTTHSFDYVRPGARAWLPNSTSAPYTLAAGALYPTGTALASTLGTTGEFGLDSRAATAALGRLNLNRPLPDYPQADATGFIDLTVAATLTQFNAAQSARQQMAQDIFNCLRWVVTGDAPGTALPAAGTPAYDALRWLAQLSVNIVDYRDNDDYMTPFNWDTTDPVNGWVFGTEPSRALLNEAYAEIDNLSGDLGTMKATAYNVNFWVELINPLLQDTTAGLPTDLQQNLARLQVVPGGVAANTYAAYQVLLCMDGIGPTMRLAGNYRGDPNFNGATNIKGTANNYTPAAAPAPQPVAGVDTNVVQPANGGYQSLVGGNLAGNQGFYVLGAVDDFPGAPNAGSSNLPTCRVAGMTYQLPVTTATFPTSHAIVLQRLLYPSLPPQTDPTQITTAGYYNPYVTVDYVQGVTTWDGRTFDNLGNVLTPPTPVNLRYSLGKKQPYAADPANFIAQTPNTVAGCTITPYPTQPQQTFFQHNSTAAGTNSEPKAPDATLTLPFNWLVHLDRQTISPMELLHVSGFAPHLLTQQFMLVDVTNPSYPTGYAHRAPWFDQTTRLYRFFEYLENASRASGVGARVPGKIDINNIWDADTFLALCDAQPPNNAKPQTSGFADADVSGIFTSMFARRTPAANGMPGPNDVPFQGMSMGYVATGDTQFPSGSGINNGWLMDNDGSGKATSPRLFQVPGATHPYRQFELMTKIYNNVTTRSNVFAVWVTVGFFKVTNDQVRPVQLGAEIGKAEGRNVRHRMFAIVDRSQLIMPSVATLSAAVDPTLPQPLTIAVSALSGAGTGRNGTYNWTIQPGSTLVVDTGANQEVVFVSAVNTTNTTITAVFNRAHAAGAALAFPGNQGPIQRYDPRADEAVVPYFTVIE
jgi:hypothetical protein